MNDKYFANNTNVGDKEEKMNVLFHDDQRDPWYECPVCHKPINRICQKYCGNCGQRLGWDMEKMGNW